MLSIGPCYPLRQQAYDGHQRHTGWVANTVTKVTKRSERWPTLNES
jgi:hypothetical protein